MAVAPRRTPRPGSLWIVFAACQEEAWGTAGAGPLKIEHRHHVMVLFGLLMLRLTNFNRFNIV